MQPEQIVVGGVYLPMLLVCLAMAALVYWALRWLFKKTRTHRLFWHPALAGAAVYTLVASGIILWFTV